MKMSKDCRTPAEYNRYHAELSVFLKLPATRKALGKECTDAIFKMKLSLHDKENKLAGYVCHGIKNNMGAMTTSPVEGQNKHIRHGEDMASVEHHTNLALRRIVTCIQRNFRKRKANAHCKLARGCVFQMHGQVIF